MTPTEDWQETVQALGMLLQEARQVARVYHSLLLRLAPNGDLGISAVLGEFEPIYPWLKEDQ